MDSIAELLGSLSEKDMDALRDTAKAMFGEEPTKEEAGVNPELMHRVMRIMGNLESGNSARSGLIAALKPYLSAPRQKRADEAMQMLKLLDVLPLLREMSG